MSANRPKFIVGVGGSAGGLAAYKALLEALPADLGMAYVIVAHLHPAAYSHMAEILSRHTEMPVMVAYMEMPIWTDVVYVIASNSDLFIEDYSFRNESPRKRGNVQVDLLFCSLAEALGRRAIGIVLSGYDGDGTAGCVRIKEKGGTTFAQDMSAEVNVMPLSAQKSGCIDFVLPPAKIARELQRISRLP